MLRLRPNIKGETMIEVMIALSILGMVLGMNYALASRSLRGSRAAQERTEASVLAQSSIETIKAYAQSESHPALIFPASPTTVCVGATIANIQSNQAPEPPPSALCQNGRYSSRVEITPLGGNQYDYVVTVEWDNPANGGVDRVVMRYRWSRIV